MKRTYRHILFSVPLLCSCFAAHAQRLVANPSFEEVNICTEYNAPCSPSAWESVAPEHLKMHYLYSAEAVAGTNVVRLVHRQGGLRNYIQAKLLCPVEAGRQYKLVIVAGKDFRGPLELSVRLDTGYIYRLSALPLDGFPPTVTVSDKNAVETKKGDMDFYRMEKVFTAPKNATHLIVGDFSKGSLRGEFSLRESFFIDSVDIIPMESRPPCEQAPRVKEELYAQHRRHTVPPGYFKQEKAKLNTWQDKRHCITLSVKDESIFTARGRARYPEAAARLDSIIRVYDPYAGTRVIVTGYAFRPGTGNYNKVLSAVQAQKVKDVLVYRHGFAVNDVEVYGRGNAEPRFDTATEAGREDNNFVEIEFCLPKPPPAPVAALAPPPAPDTLVIPDVLFRFNSSELNTKLYKSLDSLVARIPRNDTTVQLQVLGYTDNVGTEAYNLSLSRSRAAAVADYLKGKGLEKFIRHVSGLGESAPVAPNDTQEGRQRNRRVEIIIYTGSD
ncbi:MAG: OmpA family protein [Chitinophaga sp.]